MSFSNLSDKNNKEPLKEIKVRQLNSEAIKPNDEPLMNKLANELYIKSKIPVIILSFPIFILILCNIGVFQSDMKLKIAACSGILAISAPFFYIYFYTLRMLIVTKKRKYKRAQYGVVKRKYCRKNPGANSNRLVYYISVLFPMSQTYINDVCCSDNLYKTLSEGDSVLVISFDNKTIYAISSNSNYDTIKETKATSPSRLTVILDSGNNTPIKVNNLQRVKISDSDLRSAKKILRSFQTGYIFMLIILLNFLVPVSKTIYNKIKETNIVLNEEFVTLLVIELVLLLITTFLAIKAFKPIISKYKKAQYGIVKEAYSLGRSSSRNYYVSVIFPETKTYLQGVNCSIKHYPILSEGNHPVLVISFDNKTCYAVPVDRLT